MELNKAYNGTERSSMELKILNVPSYIIYNLYIVYITYTLYIILEY